MSATGGAWKALQRGRSIQCEAIQIFVKNNMRWFGRPPRSEEITLFKKERAGGDFSCIFGHAGYLINLAAPASANRDRSIQSLIQEIDFATTLGLPFIVMHPGAHLGSGEEAGLRQVAGGLDEVLAATKESPVRIALENTAGQGTCLGDKVEHLAEIYARVKRASRLAVCLDTAHLFAAGYDIRSRKGWRMLLKRFDPLLGLAQIVAFHLNDSKTSLGSRVDRHAHIGRGHIGLESFRLIVNDLRFKDHPGCLETPKTKDLHEDVENLNTLRALRNDPSGNASRN